MPAPLPRLLLFARAPVAGRVKTRLRPALSAEEAAALYRAFLEDAARTYLQPDRWDSVLCAEGDPRAHGLGEIFSAGWRRRRQAHGDLGRRLADAFAAECADGVPACAAVGSDHPALSGERLAELYQSLRDGNDAALVPAEDGGYCAIGLSARVAPRAVFSGIAWSTPEVLDQTIRNLETAGLRYRVLAPAYDVDRPEDLARLRRDLETRDPSAPDYPAATARVLATLTAASAGRT